MAEMSEREMFLLDLHGFLVVPDFLTAGEVGALNASFDANWSRRHLGNAAQKRHGVDQFHGMLSWPKPHSQPFRDLLAHRKLTPCELQYKCRLSPGFCIENANRITLIMMTF